MDAVVKAQGARQRAKLISESDVDHLEVQRHETHFAPHRHKKTSSVVEMFRNLTGPLSNSVVG